MCQDHYSSPANTQSNVAGVQAEAARMAGLHAFSNSVPGTLDEAVGQPLIIEGATYIDPVTGHATEDSVVVLDGGVVTAVGTRDETRDAVRDVDGRAARIDATGSFVVPGLVDSHVHASDFEGAATILRHGATTVRSGSTSFYQDIALARVPAFAPGLVPRLLAAGLHVSPEEDASFLADPDLAPLAGRRKQLSDPQDFAYITRVNLSRGASVIKTRSNPRAGLPEQDPLELALNEEQLSAIVHAANGRPVLCHGYSAEGIAGAVAAGVSSIEHGVYVSEETLAVMTQKGTAFTPTHCTIRNLSRRDDEVLAARGRQYLPVLTEAVRMANEMGVTVVGGTDTAGHVRFIPIGEEAHALAQAGLTHLQALQSITTVGARILGVDRYGVGRLVRGGVADLVVLGGNPLENTEALYDVKVVVAQGIVVRNDLA